MYEVLFIEGDIYYINFYNEGMEFKPISIIYKIVKNIKNGKLIKWKFKI